MADDIRTKIIQTVSQNGGHLSSNLGMVEITLALHRVFDTPKDKILFDVGHQAYAHKLITGRYEAFDTLRTYGGLSGFPRRCESVYDCFEAGHASTAISAALGFARARDARGEKHHVVAVVGDGALTGGMCYEALNDCGNSKTRLILVLNDNEMSIAQNVGALSKAPLQPACQRRLEQHQKARQKPPEPHSGPGPAALPPHPHHQADDQEHLCGRGILFCAGLSLSGSH